MIILSSDLLSAFSEESQGAHVWMSVLGDDEADMFVMAVLPGSKTELPFISIVSNTAPLSPSKPL